MKKKKENDDDDYYSYYYYYYALKNYKTHIVKNYLTIFQSRWLVDINLYELFVALLNTFKIIKSMDNFMRHYTSPSKFNCSDHKNSKH